MPMVLLVLLWPHLQRKSNHGINELETHKVTAHELNSYTCDIWGRNGYRMLREEDQSKVPYTKLYL